MVMGRAKSSLTTKMFIGRIILQLKKARISSADTNQIFFFVLPTHFAV